MLTKVASPIGILFVLSLVGLALSSCERDTSWRQRLTIVIETPTGVVSGSTVTEVVKTETSGFLVPPEARGVRSSVTGEAIAIEIAPERWLFALLSGSGDEKREATHWVYPAYKLSDAESYSHAMSIVKAQPYDAPVPMPPEGWPIMVTFADITQPQTVRQVDPTDLARHFGEGVMVSAVTIEITESPITIGILDQLLPWLGSYPEPSLGKPTGDGTLKNAPFFRLVHMGDFIRRVQ
jgi:hypothetical protein